MFRGIQGGSQHANQRDSTSKRAFRFRPTISHTNSPDQETARYILAVQCAQLALSRLEKTLCTMLGGRQ